MAVGMGYYRLLLAFCVLYSHAFGDVYGWNIGVVAVISFFVMSGYVMALLVDKYYPSITDIGSFYLDRAARIFPQYLFYLAITAGLTALLGFESIYLTEMSANASLLNIALLPLGYYMAGLENAMYIPQAWSLGLELTFYLIFPLFWLLPRPFKLLGTGISICIFLMAALGHINFDWFGYRLLPGTLFMFILGAGIAKPPLLAWWVPFIAAAFAVLLAISAVLLPNQPVFLKEVSAGLALGIGAVAVLRNAGFGKNEKLASDLSYGVFLNHFVFIYLAERFGISLLAVPFFSIAAAYGSYLFVEKPALNWRKALRANLDIKPDLVIN